MRFARLTQADRSSYVSCMTTNRTDRLFAYGTDLGIDATTANAIVRDSLDREPGSYDNAAQGSLAAFVRTLYFDEDDYDALRYEIATDNEEN